MPRSNDPGEIKTGPGKQVPGESPLTLTGIPGPPLPAIGEVDGHLPPAGGGGDAGLAAHIASGHAHPAPAIYTEEGPETLFTGNVEGQLDELAGGMPPEPPKFGFTHSHMAFTGIPDWGFLRMGDAPLNETLPLTTPNDAADLFPYYYETPTPTMDSEFVTRGEDPQTDPTFNISPAQKASAGAYTRPPVGPGSVPVTLTTAILPRGSSATEVEVSGSLYPADRGVLALLHWPHDDGSGNPADIAAFLAQDLRDRVKCAILLGQGILGEGPCSDGSCDGGTGGIFGLGEDADGDYNPFAYPGQASGQYDLREISTGLSAIDGSVLRSPWDDKNGDGAPGWQRIAGSERPGPGQVRLGTDPTANIGGAAPVSTYGIPILGADQSSYDDGFGSPPSSPLGDVVISSGNPFFRYRLPYLADYTQVTGVRWTPGGVPGTETSAKEKARYFTAAPLSAVATLTQAGDYPNFLGDQYSWQLARFRLMYFLEYTGTVNDYQEHGTYFFIHFKKEADFEAFARDGVMPDDLANGYEVYSAQPAFIPDPSIEDTGNRVNEETSFTAFAPAGRAPAYGYKARPYHTMRVNIFEDPDGLEVDPGDITTSSAFAGNHGMQVSGVTYWIPRNPATGISSASLLADTQVANFFVSSYRTDDRALADPVSETPPALLSSPNPAFIGLAPFAYEEGAFSTSTGAAGSFYTPTDYFLRKQRIEIPYTHLNGVSAFTPTAGPLTTDPLTIAGSSYPTISLTGDEDTPSFSADARLRTYFRLPRGNTELDAAKGIQPTNSTLGQGSTATDTSGQKILFHSSSFEPINLDGDFGNYHTGGLAYPELLTAAKDTFEPFLDEVYRYLGFAGIDPQFGAGATAALDGPGMGGRIPFPIETPTRVSAANPSTYWPSNSWLLSSSYAGSLATPALVDQLQVSGLPDRNPLLRGGQADPFPSAGVLLYPHKNYLSGYSPLGPDYSSLTGSRWYVRCFDASFGGAVAAAGYPFVTLRVNGLQLQDFEYTAPGPGNLASAEGITIQVKVPGLTTWMDLGRPDGAGPSKQDPLLDGAGCMVIGPDTFDAVDDVLQIVYSQVKVNVGPFATLFATTGLDGVGVGRVPVLVRILMVPGAASFNLEKVYNPVTRTFIGIPAPGASPGDVRGILGIGLV